MMPREEKVDEGMEARPSEAQENQAYGEQRVCDAHPVTRWFPRSQEVGQADECHNRLEVEDNRANEKALLLVDFNFSKGSIYLNFHPSLFTRVIEMYVEARRETRAMMEREYRRSSCHGDLSCVR